MARPKSLTKGFQNLTSHSRADAVYLFSRAARIHKKLSTWPRSSHRAECGHMLGSFSVQAAREKRYTPSETCQRILAQAGARRKVDLVSARAKAFDTGAVQDA